MKKINFFLLLFFLFNFSFAAPVKPVSRLTIRLLSVNQEIAGQLTINNPVERVIKNLVLTGNHISISNGQSISFSRQND